MALRTLFFFDFAQARLALAPFSFTRPVATCRVGILTVAEKWRKRLSGPDGLVSVDFLGFPPKETGSVSESTRIERGALCLDGRLLPDEETVRAVAQLPEGAALHTEKGELIAYRAEKPLTLKQLEEAQGQTPFAKVESRLIRARHDLFLRNREEIIHDFALLTDGRRSAPLPDPHTRIYGKDNLFLEEGASVRAAVVDAEAGPVYLGAGSQVHPGSVVRGAFALCEGAHLNIGAKVKGDTTIGPYCKVGGEVSNSILFGYSNKGHDGFLGNSVLGEWCNLGADTNCSNLKNNYGTVKAYDYATGQMEDTGLQFLGLMMGDHAKSGINTMFNTGTVVGVAANVFGAGFPPKRVPSFAWGEGAGGSFETFDLEKAVAMAERMMARRGLSLTQADRERLQAIRQADGPV